MWPRKRSPGAQGGVVEPPEPENSADCSMFHSKPPSAQPLKPKHGTTPRPSPASASTTSRAYASVAAVTSTIAAVIRLRCPSEHTSTPPSPSSSASAASFPGSSHASECGADKGPQTPDGSVGQVSVGLPFVSHAESDRCGEGSSGSRSSSPKSPPRWPMQTALQTRGRTRQAAPLVPQFDVLKVVVGNTPLH
jgi:uncharacterized low-complexity protein